MQSLSTKCSWSHTLATFANAWFNTIKMPLRYHNQIVKEHCQLGSPTGETLNLSFYSGPVNASQAVIPKLFFDSQTDQKSRRPRRSTVPHYIGRLPLGNPFEKNNENKAWLHVSEASHVLNGKQLAITNNTRGPWLAAKEFSMFREKNQRFQTSRDFGFSTAR